MMIAQQRPDPTDHAWTISIFQHQNHAARPRFNWTAVYADDARGCAEKRAAYRDIFAFGRGGDLEQVGVIADRAQTRLGDFKAECFGKSWRVDFVYFVSTGAL